MHFLQFGLRLLDSGRIFNEGVTSVERKRKSEIVAQASESAQWKKCLSVAPCVCSWLCGEVTVPAQWSIRASSVSFLGVRLPC